MNLKQSQQNIAYARQLFKQKEYPEALQLCNTLLSTNDQQPDVLTLKALVNKQLGDYEEAGKAMDLALGQSPNHAVMLFTAALINLKLSNFDQAKKQAMKAAREAPENPQIICQCAMILGRAGEFQNALQILERYTQKNQGLAEAWYLIGKFQADLGHDEAAEYALQKCISLEPGHVNAIKRLDQVSGSNT